MTNELRKALEHFFSLPNWENRIGPWKDLNEAAMKLNTVFKRELLLDPQSNVMGELHQWVDQYRDNLALGENAAVEGMGYLLKAWERHGLSKKIVGVNEIGGAKNCVHRMIEVLQAFEGKLAIMEQMAIDAIPPDYCQCSMPGCDSVSMRNGTCADCGKEVRVYG